MQRWRASTCNATNFMANGTMSSNQTSKQVDTFIYLHFLSVFKTKVNWDEVGTYDDFLLEAAFNETLSGDLRVLLAINYGTIVDTMTLSPHFENRCYKLFCQIAPDCVKD